MRHIQKDSDEICASVACSYHVDAEHQEPISSNKKMQSTIRYDIVRTDRLKYLSHFSSGYKETQCWASAFKQYTSASAAFNASLSRVRINYCKDDYGRYHPNTDDYHGLCLQTMNKSVRNFLVAETAQDIDIVNSAPTVLLELFRKHGYPCSSLAHFVDNYDDCKKQMRDAGLKNVRSIKNWMLFGSGDVKDSMPSFIGAIKIEMKHLVPLMRPHYEAIYNRAVASDEEKRQEFEQKDRRRRRDDNGGAISNYCSNVDGLFYSYLYQHYEGKLLRAMDTAGRDSGFWGNDVSWIHDGMVVYPTRGVIGDVEMAVLTSFMKDKTGISVKLLSKPMRPSMDIDITKLPEKIVIDPDSGHLAAARIAAMALAGRYVRDRTSEYLMEEGGEWIRNKELITLGLQSAVFNLNIWRLVRMKNSEEFIEKPFTESCTETQKIVTVFRSEMNKASTEDWAKDVVLGGIHKIAFRDGYYEFLEESNNNRYGRFIEGGIFNTFCRVNRMFPIRVQTDIDFVHQNILDPIFSNTENGLKETFLAAVARALAGDMDKVTYIIHGPRNSGKSVLFQFMDNAFGHYVRAVPTAIFACGEGAGSETFRQTSWMSEAETARIIKMSELPPSRDAKKKIKMDGSKIKAFQSMKEGIMARALYSSQRPYYSLGTGFFLMNDVPEFLPLDSMDKCQLFEFPNEFVSQREKQEDWANPFKIVARPDIEMFIKEDRCINAFIHILFDSYRPEPIQPLPSMIQCKEDVMVGQGDEMYSNIVEVTMDSNDKITFVELKKALEDGGIQDNTIAMGRALRRIIEDEFKRHGRDPPPMSDIKKQDNRRQSPTFRKQFYHFIKLRQMYDGTNTGMRNTNYTINGDGAFAEGFIP